MLFYVQIKYKIKVQNNIKFKWLALQLGNVIL